MLGTHEMITRCGGARAVVGLVLLGLVATGRAADERSLFRPKVTLELKDVPVFKVVDALRDQTGLCFHPFHTPPSERARMYGTGPAPSSEAWNWQLRQINPTVSVSWKDLPLEQALADLEQQGGLTVRPRARGGGNSYLTHDFGVYRKGQYASSEPPVDATKQASVAAGEYRVRLAGVTVVRSRSWAFGAPAGNTERNDLQVSLAVDCPTLWEEMMLIGMPRAAKAALDGKDLAMAAAPAERQQEPGRSILYPSLQSEGAAFHLSFTGAQSLDTKSLSLQAELLVRAPMKEQLIALNDLSGKPAEAKQGDTTVTLTAWGPAAPQAGNRGNYRRRLEQPAWQATLRIRRPLIEADGPEYSPYGQSQWNPVRLPLVAVVTADGKRLLGSVNATPTEVEQTGDTMTYTTTVLWPAMEAKPDGLLVAVLEPGGPMQHLPITFEHVPLP